jgi:hypothetical protein
MFLAPAILGVPLATVLLGAQVSLAQLNECRIKPDSSARPGTHWLYRVNPRDNRRCWFLSHEGVKARVHARNGKSSTASARPMPRRENGADAASAQDVEGPSAQLTLSETAAQIASAQGASAESAFIETSVDEHETLMDFAARWPDLPKALDLDRRERATMSNAFAEEQADGSEQLPLIPPESEGMAAFMPAGTAAALVLLLAGAVFMLARQHQSDHRDHWRAAAGRRRPRQQQRPDSAEMAGRASPSGARRDGSPPEPTDPVHDLKASLQELMDDLQRAGAASGPLRSFAPPAVRIVGTRRPVADLPVLAEIS